MWAWDASNQELVLLIPVVLAMLGDNPMQSEMACHIGLRGKYFCRTCQVKGVDVGSANPETAAELQAEFGNAPCDPGSLSDGQSDAGSNTSVASTSSNLSTGEKAGKKGRRKETMQEMLDRIKRCISVRPPSLFLFKFALSLSHLL